MSAFPTRVLVIDDDKNLRDLLSLAFVRRGYAVSAAEDGEKGVAAARAVDFDVVICDIMMPGIDGFAVLEVLKRERPQIEVIMVTGSAQAGILARAVELGAFEFRTKPYSLKGLCALIDAAAAKRRGSAAPS